MKTFPPLAIEGRKADGSPDLSTPRGRALAFNARIDALTLPIAKGGPGLSFNAAIERMQDTPEDSSLLAAMGYQRKTFWNAEAKPVLERDKYDKSAFEKPDPVKGAIRLDLWKPSERQKAFDAKMDSLTRPKEQGGDGMTPKEAINWMRSDVHYRQLLRHMGDAVSTSTSSDGNAKPATWPGAFAQPLK